MLGLGNWFKDIVDTTYPATLLHPIVASELVSLSCQGQSGMGTATYTWDAASGATSYDVTESASPDMSAPFVTTVTGTTADVGVGGPHDHGNPVYVTVTAVYGTSGDIGSPTGVDTEACSHP